MAVAERPEGEPGINADPRRYASVDTAAMDWQPSPSPAVRRKRVYHAGPAEKGRVTSVVRYEPGSTFPPHDHPAGEEILVLDGTFSDEHGSYPAGMYLLNPEGFGHAPFSEPGCTLFVKLRQFAGIGRRQTAIDTGAVEWAATDVPGIDFKRLYEQEGYPERMALLRFAPGTTLRAREAPGGEELFVLSGSIEGGRGRHGAGSWLRYPPGDRHTLFSRGGCVLYACTGAVAGLCALPD